MSIRGLYGLLAPRAYTAIMFGALFCTLAVKFFHSWRNGLVSEYFGWILSDISVLLAIEVVLATVCFRRPRKSVIRTATTVAAIVCTWSVMNAGWLIRTGTQILPSVLLSLFKDPVSSLSMVGVNLIKMPKVAVALLVPSIIALTFFFSVLTNPPLPNYNPSRFKTRIIISLLFIFIAVLTSSILVPQESAQPISEELYYNCQLRAVSRIFLPDYSKQTKTDFVRAKRKLPSVEQIENALTLKSERINHNVVILVFEGVQYRYTSLVDRGADLTPYLATLAKQGVEFTNTRSSLPHSTKALFALLTGFFPSASQDIAEAVPALKPYPGIATVLKEKLNFRTAFFESGEGSFECGAGLAYNLGFDKFWARENLNDPNAFLGYFSADEFSLLRPMIEWIKADERPFCLVIMCSVTHDPYVVPKWYATPAKEPVQRYRQTISYTDKFVAALDAELAKLNLADKTIFCTISDHAEAFGEHGLFAHERIAFDEVLRIPWVIRAPSLLKPGTKIEEPVSSVDLVPTVLELLGFKTEGAGFDGVNALGPIPADRKVYFASWMGEGPAGFVKGNYKFMYSPMNKMLSVYDLRADPLESVRVNLSEQQAREIADQIIAWRANSVFGIQQYVSGKAMLFDNWLCNWRGRFATVKYHSSN